MFVPLLGISVAALSGHLQLAGGFEWIGSWPAFACFLTATIVEIVAFYVPWLDNLLDTIATPAAAVAGIIVTASVVSDMSPLLHWSLAVIAGGGVATTMQAGSVALRDVVGGDAGRRERGGGDRRAGRFDAVDGRFVFVAGGGAGSGRLADAGGRGDGLAVAAPAADRRLNAFIVGLVGQSLMTNRAASRATGAARSACSTDRSTSAKSL